MRRVIAARMPRSGSMVKHAAHAQAGAFHGGDAHVRAYGFFGNAVEQIGIDRVHPVIGQRGQVIGNSQMIQVVLRIDLDGVVSLGKGAANGALESSANP